MPMMSFVGSFLSFNLAPKKYLWQIKKGPVRVVETAVTKENVIPEDELPLKIAEASELKNMKNKIETGKKGASSDILDLEP